MPRSRSGSFYCPLEPALPPLSISQKAAISTCPVPSSTPKPSSNPIRRHVRSPSFDGADGLASVTLPAVKIETTTIGITQPLSLRGKIQSHIIAPKRYPWSPFKPSPLRRQTNAAPPLCPSALWTTHPELLPLYQSSSSPSPSPSPSQTLPTHKSRPRTQSSLRQSVTRHAFLSGPMGEKTHLYGLRVAWCVFGDVKEALAKDIFVRGSQAGHHHTTHTVVEEDVHHTEHVEVVQSDALSPPPPRSRSRLRRENSFIWDAQGPLLTPVQLLAEEEDHFDVDVHAVVLDNLSDTDSESEYSEDDDEEEDTTDTETESAKSDDLDIDFDIELSLDEEEEVQRDILALLSTAAGVPRAGDKALDGNVHTWTMMSFEL